MVIRILLYIAAGLSMVYGISILNVNSGSKFYMFWEVLAVCLVALAFCLKFKVFSKIPKALTVTLCSLAGVLAVATVIILVLLFGKFSAKGKKGLDYVLVLGAQMRTDGPSVVLRYRLETAVEYLKENPETKCICSGGQGTNEPCTEAQGMKDYIVAHGIDGSRIILEDRSTNTRENIKNSAALIPDGATIGIITNNFHLYRALYLTKRYGLKNIEGIAAPSTPYYLPNNMIREVIGLVKDIIVRKGYTD